MTGRSAFSFLYPFVLMLSSVFRFIPAFLFSILWSLLSPFGGNFSALLRYCLLAKRVQVMGANVYFGPSIVIKNYRKFSIGKNVSIHAMCYIDAQGGLLIGDNVSIAHQTSILTFNHTWTNPTLPIKYNPVELKQVIIEDDVWVGCGVRIMPGVRLGRRSIVAAGAVVTKDVPAGVLVAGVPAKVVRIIVS